MEPLREAFSKEASKGGMPIDRDVYRQYGVNPIEPVLLGSGSLNAEIGFFGRDPGRTEIELREPFIGKGGQHIRNGLHRSLYGGNCPSIDASIEAGRSFFWGNTVPYKPIGNKAWSMAIKRRFAPLVEELLVEHWTGNQLLTCGRVAFFWFSIAEPSLKPALESHWADPDRFTTTLDISLGTKTITLHPLPHPSPLNAAWYKLFPDLLDARLQGLGVCRTSS